MNTIKTRIVKHYGNLQTLVQSDFNELGNDGYSHRVRFWKMGLKKWLERPILGWGPGSVRYLFEHSTNKMIRSRSQSRHDFHNTYLQLLVQTGLMGIFFFIAQLWLVVKSAWDARIKGWMSSEVFFFIVGSLSLFLIMCLADMRTKNHYGRFFLIIIGGIAYAFRFRNAYLK